MKITPIPISHDRLVELKPISQEQEQYPDDVQTRYFVYEINDNRWQNVTPEGETEYDLQSIKQKPAQLPIGTLTVDKQNGHFNFEGDQTISPEDQTVIFKAIS